MNGNEQPLKSYGVSGDDMGDYLDMVTPKSEATVQNIPKISEQKDSKIITPVIAPSRGTPTKEELECRKNLMDDYLGTFGHAGTVNETATISQDENSRQISEIKQHINEQPVSRRTDEDALPSYKVSDTEIDYYLGVVDPSNREIIIQEAKKEISQSKLKPMFSKTMPAKKEISREQIVEEFEDVNEEEDITDEEFGDAGITVNNDTPQLKSYLTYDFYDMFVSRYGLTKTLKLDKLFDKQYDMISSIDNKNITNTYFKMLDKINIDYERNTKHQNFENQKTFFDKFNHYMQFQEDLVGVEEDLADTILEIDRLLKSL